MYFITGADGKEYGPVSADRIRQWITEGRANARTRVRAAESTEWTELGAIAEFSDLLQPGGAPPPLPGAVTPPPAGGPPPPAGWEAAVCARDYTIKIGAYIERGWEMLKKDFFGMMVPCLVYMLVYMAMSFIPFLGTLASLLLGGVLSGGLWLFYIRRVRGEAADAGMVFAGFSMAFVPLMLAGLVSGLLTMIGIILLIIPGIYLAVSWIFTCALVIDRKMDFWPAMELSRKVVGKHWFAMFGLVLVLGLINILGLLALIVGLLVTMPLNFLVLAIVYEDIFVKGSKQD